MSDSGPISLVKSVIDGAVGIAKQVLGIVFSNDRLKEQGEAQQDKADAEKDVAKKEAEAEGARAEAKTQEARQKAAKNS
ncbi:CsbD family protein [Mycolicibacterium hodleri]|uniref:CsbD family protein n=1 Tax=Mycolicibacterium hodleri TaxID=49897 RepID=A0A502EFA1_9MYCO|nr:CsbD family protein [Mycolicibacterium hodleri]TPG35652.1 CsbD family protein [Mycolicibacterium hodleri]